MTNITSFITTTLNECEKDLLHGLYTYCAQAFVQAQREDKPVLLFFGSIPKEHIGNCFDFMTSRYVCVYVDPWLRQDVYAVYSSINRLLGNRNSFPMLAFATPSAKPFFICTLQSVGDRLSEILDNAYDAWARDKLALVESAMGIVEYCNRPVSGGAGLSDCHKLDEVCKQAIGGLEYRTPLPLHHCLRDIMGHYDQPVYEARDIFEWCTRLYSQSLTGEKVWDLQASGQECGLLKFRENVLTGLNCLYITGLFMQGEGVKASELLRLLEERLVVEGRLMAGDFGVKAWSSDYALYISALLADYEYNHNDEALSRAEKVWAEYDELFGATGNYKGGTYFYASDAPSLVIRPKMARDCEIPPDNAVNLLNLNSLYNFTKNKHYRELFCESIEHFSGEILNNPADYTFYLYCLKRLEAPSQCTTPQRK